MIFSSTTSAMLAPPLDAPFAVRLDSPAALNRPGLACAPLRALERRRLAAARVILPWGQAGANALPPGSAPAIVVPSQIVPSEPVEPDRARERLAVAYTPDPKAKGLDLVVAGFAEAAVEGARLAVYGIDPDHARDFLRAAGDGGAGRARAPPDSLPSASSERRCARRSSYASGGALGGYGRRRWRRLLEGALLATLPAGGAYEALPIARELEPSLVGSEITAAALGDAIAIRLLARRRAPQLVPARCRGAPRPLRAGRGRRDRPRSRPAGAAGS